MTALSKWDFLYKHDDVEQILHMMPLPNGCVSVADKVPESMNLDQKLCMFDKKRKRLSRNDAPFVKHNKLL